MAVTLKNAADHCMLLEKEDRAVQEDLKRATTEAEDARSAMRAMKEDLRQAGDIAAGKPFVLRRKFGDPKYVLLDRLWSTADTYLDLAVSAADAAEHFRDQEDREVEKLFWSQFHNPECSLSLADRLAEWAELNRLSGPAMKYVMSPLWPERPEPKSYFNLV